MSERIENPGPGIHRGFSYDEYAAWPGIRKSSLFALVTDTPAHYKYKIDNPEPPTPAMKFGTALHTMVLEPERFKQQYGTGPINPKTDEPYGPKTKKTLEWKDETGLEVVSPGDLAALEDMAAEVFKHDAASDLLAKAETEVSMMWEDEETGVLLQGRIDIWMGTALLFADLKTVRSAHPKAWNYDSRKYGYPMQGAMYWDGARIVMGKEPYKPQFIIVEKTPPYVVAVREIEINALHHAREQYRSALKTLATCELENNWPAYPGVDVMEVLE